jgi:hypothetical protein
VVALDVVNRDAFRRWVLDLLDHAEVLVARAAREWSWLAAVATAPRRAARCTKGGDPRPQVGPRLRRVLAMVPGSWPTRGDGRRAGRAVRSVGDRVGRISASPHVRPPPTDRLMDVSIVDGAGNPPREYQAAPAAHGGRRPPGRRPRARRAGLRHRRALGRAPDASRASVPWACGGGRQGGRGRTLRRRWPARTGGDRRFSRRDEMTTRRIELAGVPRSAPSTWLPGAAWLGAVHVDRVRCAPPAPTSTRPRPDDDGPDYSTRPAPTTRG